MRTGVKNFIISLIVALHVICIGYLGQSTNHPLQWLVLAVIGMVSAVTILMLYKAYHEYDRALESIKFHNTITATFAEIGEFNIFDEFGKSIFTTHPHIYPNKKEFLRKILMRIAPTPESVMFKKWTEEHNQGEVILTSGDLGAKNIQRRFLGIVNPINRMHTKGQNLIFVGLLDLTNHLKSIHALQNSLKQIEDFIDTAPFGSFYLDPKQHIIAVNETFAKWLHTPKSQIIGHHIETFLDEIPHRENNTQTHIITIKPKSRRPFRAFWLDNDKQPGSPEIICKVNDRSTFYRDKNAAFYSELTFNNSRIAAVIINKEGKILGFNPSFANMIDESVTIDGDELRTGLNLFNLFDVETKEDVMITLLRAYESRESPHAIEIEFSGNRIHTTAYASIVEQSLDPNKEPQMMIQFIDISEQKRLEQQFIQSQKMQAVGQLAGGIAHDFNNLLTAMIGFCDLLLQRYMPNDPSYNDVIQIKQNANRAANLVRQLLAFSRQQTLQPRLMNITDVLSELSALLRRLIGARIELNIHHGRNLWPVRADMSQFEQVVINLAVNARDAMDDGGTLSIKTSNITNNQPTRVGHEIIPKGDFALIEVLDTGSGIPTDVIERIFEPFFSTKEVGAGTGLGLSTVYGIIRQTGGFITVESEMDVGTCFKIYLPRFHGAEKNHTPEINNEEIPASDLTGGEKILLVEDEDAVRMFSARALREKGYEVIEAASGEDALAIAKEHIKAGKTFDLLVTDVVMPKMDGPTLNKRIRDVQRDIKTIFISGYTEDTFRKNLGHNEKIHFLGKPFSLKDLAVKVKEVLKQ